MGSWPRLPYRVSRAGHPRAAPARQRVGVAFQVQREQPPARRRRGGAGRGAGLLPCLRAVEVRTVVVVVVCVCEMYGWLAWGGGGGGGPVGAGSPAQLARAQRNQASGVDLQPPPPLRLARGLDLAGGAAGRGAGSRALDGSR